MVYNRRIEVKSGIQNQKSGMDSLTNLTKSHRKGEIQMLIGEYSHNIDAKGRLSFPSKLRDDLGLSFIITKGLDDCLFVYSLAEWENITEKINSLPVSKGRALARFFFSGACEVSPDKQGRVLIPQVLRTHANLTKDVIVIGASNRAEIWDKDKWEAACDSLDATSVEQAMDELGF